MIDEVTLRLATVSEALTLLEDVAILPRLRRMSGSVQVEVNRRAEMRAKADWANRVERVSARQLKACSFFSIYCPWPVLGGVQ